MDSAATKTQSRRIRAYPTQTQRGILRLWFDAARWCFNETVARLKRTCEAANWKRIKTDIIHAVPVRLKAAPYQIRSFAVRDACKAMSAVKRFNRELSQDKKRGLRLGDGWAEVKFRSRKAPRQGCFIPGKAVSEQGAYRTILGKLRLAEPIPAAHGDSRLTRHNGQCHLAATHPAQRHVTETQGRVVALAPGIRNFLTFFSETSAGHIRNHAFGRIQRLCAHLDNPLSRAKLEKLRLRKRNLYAAARMRVRTGNLVEELHHQAARWLADNFDLILIPAFETKDMARRGARKLRAKSAIIQTETLANQVHPTGAT